MRKFGWPTATLILAPAEGWEGPSGPVENCDGGKKKKKEENTFLIVTYGEVALRPTSLIPLTPWAKLTWLARHRLWELR